MVLSSSQQVVVAFTVVLFAFVVLPRMFGAGTTGSKDTKAFDPRYNRKAGPGPGPGAVRGQPVSLNSAPGAKAQTLENMQQMKMMMEQEMKSDKYKPNNNKGYVFTLMPLYAIGVGLFAAYKFLKIKSTDDTNTQKNKVAKGAKKSEETENQLTELEQRLAQTEKMLNSILTQLDPLTNCVKSVAQEQKNEIMSQLQTIRYLMKKRGMDCPPLNVEEPSCERNLDDLIESLAAHEAGAEGKASVMESQNVAADMKSSEHHQHATPIDTDETRTEEEEERHLKKLDREEEDKEVEEEEDLDDSEHMPSLEGSFETNIEDLGPAQNFPEEPSAPGLRRRNRPE